MNIQKIKKIIKMTRLYQHISKKKFLPISYDRYSSMPEPEKKRFVLCAYNKHRIKQFDMMLDKIRITINPSSRFQMWIDTGLIFPSFKAITDNIPPDYSLIVKYSIDDLLKIKIKDNIVGFNNRELLLNVKKYINRIIGKIDNVIRLNPNNIQLKNSKLYFERMIYSKSESLEEALQRILFWSSLFWQSGHRLVGLGRLDKTLDLFSNNLDINTEDILIDFCDELHRYYGYKSEKVSQGDTGQIIILGGLEPNGEYFYNSLTLLFMEIFIKHRLPDPKLLLRVSEKMPYEILKKGVETIGTGIGCPLLSNDDVVVPALIDFGYNRDDAFNYVTSACWETVAYGKSLEKNNLTNINYAKSIVDMYMDDNFTDCKSFEEICVLYREKLVLQLNEIRHLLDQISWEEDPLMSLFTDGCLESGNDISKGGAIYSDYGILTVGMSNTVNSLLNIKHLVFGEFPKYSLNELKNAAIDNFENKDNIYKTLKQVEYFGHDSSETLDVISFISDTVYQNLYNYKNTFDGKIKWGYSSPDYIYHGTRTNATLDGRKAGEPLGVHISTTSFNAYTELLIFASQLDYYGHRSNGNVVDFFVSPSLINDSLDKFTLFILNGIKLGFFELQINVVDSKTLIDAKSHPGNFKNLIVRVWGFSAYFIDLPESYQDLLISRALQNEGVT